MNEEYRKQCKNKKNCRELQNQKHICTSIRQLILGLRGEKSFFSFLVFLLHPSIPYFTSSFTFSHSSYSLISNSFNFTFLDFVRYDLVFFFIYIIIVVVL